MKIWTAIFLAFNLVACTSEYEVRAIQAAKEVEHFEENDLPLVKMVLLRHLRQFSPHRGHAAWRYVVKLSPEVVRHIQQDPAFTGLNLISSMEAAPKHLPMTSRISISVIGESGTQRKVLLDEAYDSLAAATWRFQCAKRGKTWVILSRELAFVA